MKNKWQIVGPDPMYGIENGKKFIVHPAGGIDDIDNARLIEAAPELYAHCVGLLECLDYNDPWTKAARKNAAEGLRATIARVRGEV
jgi:hypothetical protein